MAQAMMAQATMPQDPPAVVVIKGPDFVVELTLGQLIRLRTGGQTVPIDRDAWDLALAHGINISKKIAKPDKFTRDLIVPDEEGNPPRKKKLESLVGPTKPFVRHFLRSVSMRQKDESGGKTRWITVVYDKSFAAFVDQKTGKVFSVHLTQIDPEWPLSNDPPAALIAPQLPAMDEQDA